MAQLQWLGDIPTDSAGGYLARALGTGVSKGFETYIATEEKEKDRELEEKKNQYQIDRLSFSNKVDLAKLTTQVMNSIKDEAKRQEMLEDPEVQAIYAAAGLPIPSFGAVSEGGFPSMTEQWKAGKDASVGFWNPLRMTPWFANYPEGQRPTKRSLQKRTVPSAATPSTSPTPQKSPYPDYPDAFLEGGVWKVIRGGKKYRIEE